MQENTFTNLISNIALSLYSSFCEYVSTFSGLVFLKISHESLSFRNIPRKATVYKGNLIQKFWIKIMFWETNPVSKCPPLKKNVYACDTVWKSAKTIPVTEDSWFRLKATRKQVHNWNQSDIIFTPICGGAISASGTS